MQYRDPHSCWGFSHILARTHPKWGRPLHKLGLPKNPQNCRSKPFGDSPFPHVDRKFLQTYLHIAPRTVALYLLGPSGGRAVREQGRLTRLAEVRPARGGSGERRHPDSHSPTEMT